MNYMESHYRNNDSVEMPEYAIYLRKSRADIEAEKLGEGETLARHRKILTELAIKKGLYIGKIYQEIVSGAESIEDRPEIKKMIEDCYAGKWAGILIVEITRLSRGSQKDAQIILDCLKFSNRNKGVKIITPTKTYDIAHNNDDEEYMEFELFMSRREYKMIKRRMDRGREQAVVEGNYMGSYRPYGWSIVSDKIGRTLVPHETEYEIGKLIYEWRVKEHLSPYKIAMRLTSMGIPTYTGNKEWSYTSITDFLRNPVNMGKVRWNERMTVKSMVDGKLVSSRPRSSHTEHYMLFDGRHKALKMVDEETWKSANKGFKSDKTIATLKLANPFAGIVVCKNCGKALAYQGYKQKNGRVSPRLVHTPSQFCSVKSVIASDVMDAVVYSLKRYIEEFELLVNNESDVNEKSISDKIEVLKKEEKRIEKVLSKIFDDYESGIYTANEFIERKAKHTASIENIKKLIHEYENTMPEKEDYEEKIMQFSEAIDLLLDDEIDASIKNEYLKQIIDRIEYSRENHYEFILDVILK